MLWGFPVCASGKEPACQCRAQERCRYNPWVWKIPWTREWQLTPVFLPGKSHGQRSPVGYIPWGGEESDTTEATVTFSYLPAFRDCPAQNSSSTPSTPWSSSPALLVYTYLFLLWLLSCVTLFETLQTVACQVPLSIGFFRKEY